MGIEKDEQVGGAVHLHGDEIQHLPHALSIPTQSVTLEFDPQNPEELRASDQNTFFSRARLSLRFGEVHESPYFL